MHDGVLLTPGIKIKAQHPTKKVKRSKVNREKKQRKKKKPVEGGRIGLEPENDILLEEVCHESRTVWVKTHNV